MNKRDFLKFTGASLALTPLAVDPVPRAVALAASAAAKYPSAVALVSLLLA